MSEERQGSPLEEILGYIFSRPDLLELALTHRSFANENGVSHNERLEFLGDSILNATTTLMLFEGFPDFPEGTLSQMRARLVSSEMLVRLAKSFDLGPSLRLGVGEIQSGGRSRDSILGDTVEAIIGGVCVDGGSQAAAEFVRTILAGEISRIGATDSPQDSHKDPRSKLLEWSQRECSEGPVYEVIDQTGPPHEPIFTVSVSVQGRELALAKGRSKQEAIKSAAILALTKRDSEGEE